jgi:pimeloyl-ACP methyl ester carboxylesterase
VKEQAVLLGPSKSIVAVITPAANPEARADDDAPTAVILNSGILHRVGANRMSVLMARALAASGTTAVRFDLSGIGDSAPRTDALEPLDAGIADVTETLDSLAASRGTRRFILIGLCSGADLSLICSSSDPRIVGAVLLEPSIPRTPHFWVHHYLRRAARLDSWRNVMMRRNPGLRNLKKKILAKLKPEPPEVPGTSRRPTLEDPEVRDFLETTYRKTLANGNQLLIILAGERRPYGNQLQHAFPDLEFGNQLRLEYFASADHVFTGSRDTSEALRIIVEWTCATSFRRARPAPQGGATANPGRPG